MTATWRQWVAWHWDWPTFLWLAWMAALLALEWLTSNVSPIESWRGNMLTEHLRPLFLSAPIVWWLAFGLWLWVGVHLLAPRLERWLIHAVG